MRWELEFCDVYLGQAVFGAMIVVAFQESLPVFRGHGVALIIHKMERALDHGKNNSVFLADHAGRVRRTGAFEDCVTCFRAPARFVGPLTLDGGVTYGPGLDVD